MSAGGQSRFKMRELCFLSGCCQGGSQCVIHTRKAPINIRARCMQSFIYHPSCLFFLRCCCCFFSDTVDVCVFSCNNTHSSVHSDFLSGNTYDKMRDAFRCHPPFALLNLCVTLWSWLRVLAHPPLMSKSAEEPDILAHVSSGALNVHLLLHGSTRSLEDHCRHAICASKKHGHAIYTFILSACLHRFVR